MESSTTFSSSSLALLSSTETTEESAIDTTEDLLLLLLEQCRCASSKSEEQSAAWNALIEYVPRLRSTLQRSSRQSRQYVLDHEESLTHVAQQVLVEWPYNAIYSQYVDEVLDACGMLVTVTTCSRLLKELSATKKTKTKTNPSSSSSSSSTNTTSVMGSDGLTITTNKRLPHPSILQACWATLQRVLLSKSQNPANSSASGARDDQNYYPKTMLDMEGLVQIILLLPSRLANACHACQLRLPLGAAPSQYYGRLVDCAWSRNSSRKENDDENDDDNGDQDRYRIALLHGLLARRHGDYVAVGLASHHSLPSSFVAQVSWNPRTVTQLVTALLQHTVARVALEPAARRQDSTSSCSRTMSSDAQQRVKILQTCETLLTTTTGSIEEQESVIHQLLLLRSSSSSQELNRLGDVRMCPLLVDLLEQCRLLASSLEELADAWSQWSFCQGVPMEQQHFVSTMIIQGLCRVYQQRGTIAAASSPSSPIEDEDDPWTIPLLQGVTHRLESSISPIRLDGMRVAQQIARRMKQDLHFEELTEWEHGQSNSKAHASPSSHHQPAAEDAAVGSKTNTHSSEEATELQGDSLLFKKKPKRVKKTKRAFKILDPDADYESGDDDDDDDDDRDSDGDDDEEGSLHGSSGDDSTVYGDELIPYDLNDREEDLVETSKPLHLLEALELLRISENDEHAHSCHETALETLPSLIRKRPDDLPDVAVSLLLQVLRMENKFGMSNFLQLRQESIVGLAVEEPQSAGQQLVQEVFKDAGLIDRLTCFAALQESAYELSGSKGLDETKDRESIRQINQPTGDSNLLETENTEGVQLARIQSKTRRKRSPRTAPSTIKNRFTPIAPLWFYALLGQFLREKDNATLWSGSTGSQLLAGVFRTLAVFVEFAGVPSAPILAKDLLELVWSFHDADVAEVRISVLMSVATSIAMLPEDRVLAILTQHGDGLPRIMAQIADDDPDQNCRKIASTISRSIVGVLETVHGRLL